MNTFLLLIDFEYVMDMASNFQNWAVKCDNTISLGYH